MLILTVAVSVAFSRAAASVSKQKYFQQQQQQKEQQETEALLLEGVVEALALMTVMILISLWRNECIYAALLLECFAQSALVDATPTAPTKLNRNSALEQFFAFSCLFVYSFFMCRQAAALGLSF